MAIGYACLAIGVPNTDQRTCTSNYVTESHFLELIAHNLAALEELIEYNIKTEISLFRISSDLIPFGSSPLNHLKWWEIFKDDFDRIGVKIKLGHLRVSMHPGQYTVLNSPHPEVVQRAVDDLNYHAQVLDSLNTLSDCKIILHIGGVYGQKEFAMDRFTTNYKKLEPSVKKRLIIENDERSYSISDVLEISWQLGIPVVFDNLHHQIHPSDPLKNEFYWIEEARKTWKPVDGPQKIHYSQQNTSKKSGSHSAGIDLDEFMKFYTELGRTDLDIMLEVKDKNLSALKCINAIRRTPKIVALELEWSRYKYTVLEHSPAIYNQIRLLLNDKTTYPVLDFYHLLEKALATQCAIGERINTAQHVWGYFKNFATDTEKKQFLKLLEGVEKGSGSIKKVKNNLLKLSRNYEQKYLLDSYYFYLD